MVLTGSRFRFCFAKLVQYVLVSCWCRFVSERAPICTMTRASASVILTGWWRALLVVEGGHLHFQQEGLLGKVPQLKARDTQWLVLAKRAPEVSTFKISRNRPLGGTGGLTACNLGPKPFRVSRFQDARVFGCLSVIYCLLFLWLIRSVILF